MSGVKRLPSDQKQLSGRRRARRQRGHDPRTVTRGKARKRGKKRGGFLTEKVLFYTGGIPVEGLNATAQALRVKEEIGRRESPERTEAKGCRR